MRYQHPVPTETEARFDVSHAIADVKRALQIYCRDLALRSPEKKITRLAALAAVIGCVWAEVHSIEVSAMRREQLRDSLGYRVIVVEREISASNARLIRNDYDRYQRRVYSRDGFRSTMDQLDLLWPREVMRVANYGAVPVEKYRSRQDVQPIALASAVATRASCFCGTLLRSTRT